MVEKARRDSQSLVKVTFTDGECKDYIMSASHKIVHYLMRQAHETGVLVLRDDPAQKSVCIPVASIRDVEVQVLGLSGEEEPEPTRSRK